MFEPAQFLIFISSPSDVIAERTKAEEVINRLSEEFAGQVCLEPIFWEYEPMRLTDTFQSQIPAPEVADLFIGILWARMGTPLPSNITRNDGSSYSSGTEYELENAWESYNQQQKPDILIYRKTTPPPFLLNPDAEDYPEKMQQREALEQFCSKWFQDEQGAYVGAFNPFATLAQFEQRLEKHLRKILIQRFPDIHSTQAVKRHWRQESPFRGLQVFEPEHAPIFFGRTRAVGEILSNIRIQAAHQHPFVLVFGMSGSGKSSLLRAGVMPLLTQPGVIEGISHWRIALFTPSDYACDALGNLASALLQEPALGGNNTLSMEQLRALLQQQNPAALHHWLHTQLTAITQAASNAVRLLVVVDQMEELFTQEALAHNDRLLFIHALQQLLNSGKVWILGSFRSDFYPRCAELPGLVELMADKGHYLLTPPLPSEIAQMIRLPANYAGLKFEEHPATQVPLDETLLNVMVENPQSLALLEFTLEALYQRRDENGCLTYAAYDAMGGIEGALAQRAEQMFNNLSAEAQTMFPRLMRTLVTVNINDASPITGRRILLNDDLLQDPPVAELFNAFINARLVVTDQLEEGVAYARIAHEALIEHWPRLQSWLNEDRQLLRIRARINDAAHYWLSEGKLPELLLPEGKPLLDADYLRTEGSDAILPEVMEYIEISMRKAAERQQAAARRAQRRLRLTRLLAISMSILACLAVVGGGIGYLGAQSANIYAQLARQEASAAAQARGVAEQERQRAEQKTAEVLRTQSLFLADLARQQTQQGNAINGMLLGLAALPSNMQQPERPSVKVAEVALRNALNNRYEQRIFTGHEAWVSHARFNPTGAQLVTASKDATARVWSTHNGKLLATLAGHRGWVNDAQFSPDGRWLVTVSDDRTARLWETTAYQLMAVLRGHTDEVWYAEFNPDSTLLVTASKDTTARVWTVPTGQPVHVLSGHRSWVNHAVFSPDGQSIATAAGSSLLSLDKTARIWSVENGEQLQVMRGHHNKVWRVQFSPDGQRLLTTSGSFVETAPKTARLWNINDGQLLNTLSGHGDFVFAAAFSPDGQRVLTASFDHTARIWDANTGVLRHELWGHEDKLRAAHFSPDGQYIATASYDKTARLWHTESGKLLAVLAGHTDKLNDVQFSPDGQQVVTASFDGTARLWATQDQHIAKIFTDHEDTVLTTAFSADQNHLWSADSSGKVKLWNIHTGQLHQSFAHPGKINHATFSDKQAVTTDTRGYAVLWDSWQGQPVAALRGHQRAITYATFAPDQQLFATTSADHTIRLWNQAGQLVHVLTGHLDTVRHAAFSPDGQTLVTVAGNFFDNIASPDNTARLWSVANGKLLHTLRGHEKSVNHAAFSPDGRLVATASHDDTARLWEVETGQLLHVLSGHRFWTYQLAFSPDGKYLVTASRDKTARLWDIQSGELIQTFQGHKDDVWKAHFSPDGQQVLTASADETARLWDVNSGQQIDVLRGHTGIVQQAIFSADGRYIATAAADSHLHLWQVPSYSNLQSLLDTAHQQLPRQLTPQQRRAFFLE